MSKRVPRLQIVSPQDKKLQCVNENIAKLAAGKPYGDLYAAFAFSAHLADEAIEAAMELGQMPGIDLQAFAPTLEFWHRLRDYNYTAALDCVGGNQSLAEALVTFRLLRNAEE